MKLNSNSCLSRSETILEALSVCIHHSFKLTAALNSWRYESEAMRYKHWSLEREREREI